MTLQSQAAVVVSFEQVDDDVVATWSGTLDFGQVPGYDSFFSSTQADDNNLISVSSPVFKYTGNDTSVGDFVGGVITNQSGHVGFTQNTFYIGETAEFEGDSIVNFDTLGASQTFGGQTLLELGAQSFDNTLAWTSSAGDTVSYTTVTPLPEPSSTALIGLGALAVMIHRRR